MSWTCAFLKRRQLIQLFFFSHRFKHCCCCYSWAGFCFVLAQACGVFTTGTWCCGSLCTCWWTAGLRGRLWSAGGGGSRRSRTKRSVIHLSGSSPWLMTVQFGGSQTIVNIFVRSWESCDEWGGTYSGQSYSLLMLLSFQTFKMSNTVDKCFSPPVPQSRS